MIVAASTTAPYKPPLSQTAWLENAEKMVEDAASVGQDVMFFCAVEQDARGDNPFLELLLRLSILGGRIWRFSLDDGKDEFDSSNRLTRICTGRNLVTEFAVQNDAEYIFHMDTDLRIPGDSISKLLDVNQVVTGGDVPAYCLKGDRSSVYDYPVEIHWNTAGFLLVHREAFRHVRWLYDPWAGLTDDPATQREYARLGYPTFVRKDLQAEHVEWLVPMEERGFDRTYHHTKPE